MKPGRFVAGIGLGAAGLMALRRWRPWLEQERGPWPPDGVQPGTALVTGASSGLGAAYARHLAARGFDLILVARRQSRLDELAQAMRERYAVRAEALVADLADPADLGRAVARVEEERDLTMLVNNAGFGLPSSFARSDIERQLDMIRVHDEASVRLARAGLPAMLARNRGAIVNVSSLAGFIPLPGNVNYSASKAYLIEFSRALQAELRGTGVRVQALCPGFMNTEFHDEMGRDRWNLAQLPAFLWMSPDEVTADSLACLEAGEVVCVPGAVYRVVAAVARNPLTSWMVEDAAAAVMRRR